MTVMAGQANRTFDLGRIDPSDPTPLYQQLRELLRTMLADGWPEDQPIPSERALMHHTGLSRMTIRQAIADLVHEGMLRRDHGRGTFVVPRGQLLQTMRGVYSFTEAVERRGHRPGSRVVRQVVVPASEIQAALLEIEVGERILELVRIRLVDDVPVMVDFTHIPLRICPSIATADLTGSLYAFLADACGLPATTATDSIEAVAAPAEVAESIQLEPGSPALLLRRLARTFDNVPIEMTDQYARPDRCHFRLEHASDRDSFEIVHSLGDPVWRTA